MSNSRFSSHHSTGKLTRRPILLRRKCCRQGLALTYTLRARADRSPVCFSIEVALGNERISRDVGADLLRAISCFRRIVRGGVTPCTLDDVLEDLRFEELF